MSLLVSFVLNVASAIIVVLLAVTGTVRPDLLRLFLIAYGIALVPMLLLSEGGQVNAGLALGLTAHAILTAVSREADMRTSVFVADKQSTYVIKGYIDGHSGANQSFTTYDRTSKLYRSLPRSVNRNGGSQFSVSMWIFIKGSVTDQRVAGKTLFLRGDKKLYKPVAASDGSNYFKTADGMDFAIACPRIHFPAGEGCSNRLLVDVNTDARLLQRFEVGSGDSSPVLRKNLLSATPNSWTLLTVTVQDEIPVRGFESGISVCVYVQDALYEKKSAPGSLRANQGGAHVLPSRGTHANAAPGGISGSYVGDVMWHNWALSGPEVAALHRQGHPLREMADGGIGTEGELPLNSRLQLDISNTDVHVAMRPGD